MNKEEYEWYVIPGFTAYDINKRTNQIRSHKHPYKNSHHIMKEKNGCVTLTDDYGKSKRISVDNLYYRTFQSGAELIPRADSDIWLGGMRSVNRNMNAGVDILNGVCTPTEIPKQNIAFSGFLDAIGANVEPEPMTKPFNINPK